MAMSRHFQCRDFLRLSLALLREEHAAETHCRQEAERNGCGGFGKTEELPLISLASYQFLMVFSELPLQKPSRRTNNYY